MKFKYTITIAILLVACTPSNQASDSQINWCYSASNWQTNNDRDIYWSSYDAESLYFEESGENLSINTMRDELVEGTERSLRLCKIWADMNNVD